MRISGLSTRLFAADSILPFLSKALGLMLCLAAVEPALAGANSPSIPVTLSFTRPLLQLDGPDGGSVRQFGEMHSERQAAEASANYSSLNGFPDDSIGTDFGRFSESAFSTNGMALSQISTAPCPLQTPAGALGDQYSAGSWGKLDFSMYESGLLPTNRFHGTVGAPFTEARGHTAALLLASLKRARAERLRVCYWVDAGAGFPAWMSKEGSRESPVSGDLFEEAALHSVYFVKYLTARYGIPIHAVAFAHDPSLPGRQSFTPEQLLRGARVLREKLDEGGLPGVRVIPCTATSKKRPGPDGVKAGSNTFSEMIRLLEGKMRDHAPFVDILSGDARRNEATSMRLPANTRYWCAFGDFNREMTNTHGFDLGSPAMLDEPIRHNTWLYRQGASLSGVGQVAYRMGLDADVIQMPETFDATNSGGRVPIAAAAVSGPHLRPGMWVVDGSLGRNAGEPYSVEGFSGPGQREVVLVTNSEEERSFRVSTDAKSVRLWRVFQATPATGARDLGEIEAPQGRLYVQAPPESVTALVATQPGRRPLLTVVVKDSAAISSDIEPVLKRVGQIYEVQVVSQTLSSAEQNRLKTKRHPVDPFGSSVFLLDDSIDRPEVVTAYRTVMAPVVVIGSTNAALLGVAPGTRLGAGEPLLVRDASDPPAELLENGLPKACGLRIGVQPRITWADLEFTLATLLKR